ncbi:MAG: SH3 domain-containing protein [Anaerolineae bacterium]|nr:SH3 domain-containing protein [Anaerolineae bacterium]MDW8173958.1 SH3 domain-containing protein [Anaerolineae bacterium]
MRHTQLKRLILIGFMALSLLAFGLLSSAQQFGSGWVGSYYNVTDFSGAPVVSRADPQINFNFGNASPIPGLINASPFAVRWNGVQNLVAGTYRFIAVADGGVRVTVNGQVVIDNLVDSGTLQTRQADVVIAGGNVPIQVDFVQTTGNAAVQFYWDTAANLALTPSATAGPTFTPTNTSLPPIPPGALRATVIRASVLNVRSAPTLGGDIVGRILRGQTYQVVGRNQNATWFLLQLSERRAWAFGYYLFIDGNEFNAPVTSSLDGLGLPPGVSDTGVLAVTRSGLRLRAAPTVNSAQIGRVTWGAFVPLVGRSIDGGWYQIVWKGTVGWVASGYLEIRQGSLSNVPVVNP